MLTPATLTVNFTANYTGSHRICWRQCNIGTYTCTNLVECVGGGNVCSAIISIMVDPESCDPVCFEGYIQAACNPENSTVDRIPWSTTFTPTPICVPYAIACANEGNTPCGVIPALTMGLNCNGTTRPEIGSIPANTRIMLCSTGVIPNLPSGYSMTTTEGCCSDCKQYTITVTKSCPGCTLNGTTVYYTDCLTKNLIRVDLTGAEPYVLTECIVVGSVYVKNTVESSFTISAGVICP